MKNLIILLLIFILSVLGCENSVKQKRTTNTEFNDLLSLFKKVDWIEITTTDIIGGGIFKVIEDENLLHEFICDYRNTCLFSKTPWKNRYVATYKIDLGQVQLLIYTKDKGKDTGGYEVIMATFDELGNKIDKLIIAGNELNYFWRTSILKDNDTSMDISIETNYFDNHNLHCNLSSDEISNGVKCILINTLEYNLNKNGFFMQSNESDMVPRKMKKDSLNREYIQVE